MTKILWIDDEIDFFKPHILFLEERGYEVHTAYNGEDALSMIDETEYDIVFLDEMMPGLDGLTVLERIKNRRPYVKTVMVTKSEEESLMEEAIGSQIDDYLTKPVNPSQILLSLKKLLQGRNISQQKVTKETVTGIREITMAVEEAESHDDWIQIFTRLMEHEITLDKSGDENIRQAFADVRRECNTEFVKFVEKNYAGWTQEKDGQRPVLSPDVVSKYVQPHLMAGKPVLMIIIDCLRYDQWLAFEDLLQPYFSMEKDYYYSILPTATPYSRNAIFSGLWPDEIHKKFPDTYIKVDESSGANQHEPEMLDFQIRKLGFKPSGSLKFHKVFTNEEIKRLTNQAGGFALQDISAIVVNSVDILAHSRSDSPIMRDIAPNEKAYRQLTRTWFEHSPIFDFFKLLAAGGLTIVVTSDHGSIRAFRGAKVVADRETSVNLRYKFGRNLKVDPKQALLVRNPAEFRLPNFGPNTDFIFAKEDNFFVYPNNYNHYLNHYRDSFQHGGISMEEMILPIITLKGKQS